MNLIVSSTIISFIHMVDNRCYNLDTDVKTQSQLFSAKDS